jgi:hypothetical protein
MTAIFDAEFGKLDLKLRVLRGTSRMVSTMAYEAGAAAETSLAISPGIREVTTPHLPLKILRDHANPQSRRVQVPRSTSARTNLEGQVCFSFQSISSATTMP